MKRLTKEQRELIEKHLGIIKSAREQHYVRGAEYDDLNELMNLYVELGYQRGSITCSSCVITFLSILGAVYESDTEIIKKEILKEEPEAHKNEEKKDKQHKKSK